MGPRSRNTSNTNTILGLMSGTLGHTVNTDCSTWGRGQRGVREGSERGQRGVREGAERGQRGSLFLGESGGFNFTNRYCREDAF